MNTVWTAITAWWFRWFGTDDIVEIDMPGGYRIGRVRAWGRRGRRFRRGDPVPHMQNHSTYDVETVEGWWANVGKGVLRSWSVKPIAGPVIKANRKMPLPRWGR